ncbi:MAG: MFS transporter [Streptococcus parasanguinis]
MMEVFATQSSYAFGKIRVWGTLGYAAGAHLAGWLYAHLSPQSVYYCVLVTILLSFFTLGAIRIDKTSRGTEKKLSRSVLCSTMALISFLLLCGLCLGVGNIGHTYIPALLMDSGLPVQIASTVVALSVVVEAPLIFFSDRFMDHWPLTDFDLSCGILLLQYAHLCSSESGLLKKC